MRHRNILVIYLLSVFYLFYSHGRCIRLLNNLHIYVKHIRYEIHLYPVQLSKANIAGNIGYYNIGVRSEINPSSTY